MMCERIQKQLSEYLDGALSAVDRQTVETHLLSCSACQKQLQELKQIRQVLKNQPMMTPPESFYAGVHARLQDRPVAKGRFSWNTLFKIAATVCTLMLVVLITHEVKNSTPPTAEQPQVINQMIQGMSREKDMSKLPVAPAPTIPMSTAQNNEPVQQKIAPTEKLPTPMAFAPAAAKELNAPVGAANVPQMSPQNTLKENTAKNASITAQDYLTRQNQMAAASGASAAPVTPRALISSSSPSGNLQKASSASTKIIRDAPTWQSLWTDSQPPVVDFGASMVVAVINSRASYDSNVILSIDYNTTPIIVYYGFAYSSAQPLPAIAYKVIPKTDRPIQFKNTPPVGNQSQKPVSKD